MPSVQVDPAYEQRRMMEAALQMRQAGIAANPMAQMMMRRGFMPPGNGPLSAPAPMGPPMGPPMGASASPPMSMSNDNNGPLPMSRPLPREAPEVVDRYEPPAQTAEPPTIAPSGPVSAPSSVPSPPMPSPPRPSGPLPLPLDAVPSTPIPARIGTPQRIRVNQEPVLPLDPTPEITRGILGLPPWVSQTPGPVPPPLSPSAGIAPSGTAARAISAIGAVNPIAAALNLQGGPIVPPDIQRGMDLLRRGAIDGRQFQMGVNDARARGDIDQAQAAAIERDTPTGPNAPTNPAVANVMRIIMNRVPFATADSGGANATPTTPDIPPAIGAAISSGPSPAGPVASPIAGPGLAGPGPASSPIPSPVQSPGQPPSQPPGQGRYAGFTPEVRGELLRLDNMMGNIANTREGAHVMGQLLSHRTALIQAALQDARVRQQMDITTDGANQVREGMSRYYHDMATRGITPSEEDASAHEARLRSLYGNRPQNRNQPAGPMGGPIGGPMGGVGSPIGNAPLQAITPPAGGPPLPGSPLSPTGIPSAQHLDNRIARATGVPIVGPLQRAQRAELVPVWQAVENLQNDRDIGPLLQTAPEEIIPRLRARYGEDFDKWWTAPAPRDSAAAPDQIRNQLAAIVNRAASRTQGRDTPIGRSSRSFFTLPTFFGGQGANRSYSPLPANIGDILRQGTTLERQGAVPRQLLYSGQ